MLNSAWLRHMIEKSAPSPGARLLALFDILGDWIDAPQIRSAISSASLARAPDGNAALLEFLTRQANQAGLREPEAIAQQLHCLALGALHAELRSPGCGALPEAKKAAQTLLQSQTPARRSIRRPAALAAGITVVLASSLFWPHPDIGHQASHPAMLAMPMQPIAIEHQPQRRGTLSPDQIAALNYSIERLRNGVCQYPQALMLPAEHRTLFLDNIVSGVVSDTSTDHAEALRNLLQKVECYYAPVAMTAS